MDHDLELLAGTESGGINKPVLRGAGMELLTHATPARAFATPEVPLVTSLCFQ